MSEADVPPGEDFKHLYLHINANTAASTEYIVLLQHQESISTAVVDTFVFQTRTEFDALFGLRDDTNQPLQEAQILSSGEEFLQTTVFIRNDFVIEEEECFTINLSNIGDAPFLCNDDGATATNFFCSHTICIEDDDGKKNCVSISLFNFYIHYRAICGQFRTNILHCSGE